MKNVKKTICLVIAIVMMLLAVPCFAVGSDNASSEKADEIAETVVTLQEEEAEETVETKDNTKAVKAACAAVAIAVVSAVSAIAMSNAISKSAEGIARQPEAGDNIKSDLMLGLVFIETVVIYALIIAILIIFVL